MELSKIEIVYEDTDCVVINKPAGMPCHPLKPDDKETALQLMIKKYPEIAFVCLDKREGGLVHRLDNNTSGLLMLARTKEAHRDLREALLEGVIQKTYLALVKGHLAEDLVLENPIAHHPKTKSKMVVIDPAKSHSYRGKLQPSQTFVTPLQTFEAATLVKVHLIGPGRRHQVRVHLSAAGYPLLGDELYGGPAPKVLPGHALHADSLVMPDGKVLTVEPPPAFREEAGLHGPVSDIAKQADLT